MRYLAILLLLASCGPFVAPKSYDCYPVQKWTPEQELSAEKALKQALDEGTIPKDNVFWKMWEEYWALKVQVKICK